MQKVDSVLPGIRENDDPVPASDSRRTVPDLRRPIPNHLAWDGHLRTQEFHCAIKLKTATPVLTACRTVVHSAPRHDTVPQFRDFSRQRCRPA